MIERLNMSNEFKIFKSFFLKIMIIIITSGIGTLFINLVFIVKTDIVQDKSDTFRLEKNYYTNELYHKLDSIRDNQLLVDLRRLIDKKDGYTRSDIIKFMNIYKIYIDSFRDIYRYSEGLMRVGISASQNLHKILEATEWKIYDKKVEKIYLNLIDTIKELSKKSKLINEKISILEEKRKKYNSNVKDFLSKNKITEKDKVEVMVFEAVELIDFVILIGETKNNHDSLLINAEYFFKPIRDLGNATVNMLDNYNTYYTNYLKYRKSTEEKNNYLLIGWIYFSILAVFFISFWEIKSIRKDDDIELIKEKTKHFRFEQ